MVVPPLQDAWLLQRRQCNGLEVREEVYSGHRLGDRRSRCGELTARDCGGADPALSRAEAPAGHAAAGQRRRTV